MFPGINTRSYILKRPTVGIVKSDFHERHSTSWGYEWLRACRDLGIDHELVDWRSIDAIERLARHDIVLWHFSHYSADEMRFARPVLAALKAQKCAIFPDGGDSDHFDDKVAQAYLLKSLNLPTPSNYPLHSVGAVEDWIDGVGIFPVVAKLRTGSGSSNVVLLKSAEQLRRYSHRMFQKGFPSRPGAVFKIASNMRSVKSLNDVVSRAKRGPEFLFSWLSANRLPRESGYVYLQEFVPSVDHDLKIVVIGEQLSYIGRAVRTGDFRASGGGGLFYDRSLITRTLVETAFQAAAALKSDCTGLDMVIDPRDGRPLILEVSYGFSHTALIAAGEHCDRSGDWHPTPLNAPRAVLDRLLGKIRPA